MIILGINAQNHDASVTVFDTDKNKILFAGHAERYSRIKNDHDLNKELLINALTYSNWAIDDIIWHENPFKRSLRFLRSGQWNRLLSEQFPGNYLSKFKLSPGPFNNRVLFGNHHLSHAAGGFYTSPFDAAAIVVIDAIGECDTTSVFTGNDHNLDRIFVEKYPHSVGLFYSAFTQLVGLKPNKEEYIFMGMAAYGDPKRFKEVIKSQFIKKQQTKNLSHLFRLTHNLHQGVSKFWLDNLNERDVFDIAAAVQEITEDYMIDLLRWVKAKTGQRNLVLSGGVALNCVCNSRLANESGFDNIWIMPNPGDAGNSLGTILNKTRQHIEFLSPYLGYEIFKDFDSEACLNDLLAGNIVGIAHGRAEFGPRALGNRSLLADPRGPTIKDDLNKIKRRQKFRPFAPIILEERVHEFFEMPSNVTSSPYMQFVAKVKRPDLYPAICHVDGTARVQTLKKEMNPKLHDLISMFYNTTKCPMLVNTSLNVKGEPLANTWNDALRFKKKTFDSNSVEINIY
jgi:carbamoyltransferase